MPGVVAVGSRRCGNAARHRFGIGIQGRAAGARVVVDTERDGAAGIEAGDGGFIVNSQADLPNNGNGRGGNGGREGLDNHRVGHAVARRGAVIGVAVVGSNPVIGAGIQGAVVLCCGHAAGESLGVRVQGRAGGGWVGVKVERDGAGGVETRDGRFVGNGGADYRAGRLGHGGNARQVGNVHQAVAGFGDLGGGTGD